MSNQSRGIPWRGYIGLSLAWLAIFGIVLLATRRPATTPIEIIPPPPTSAPTATPGSMRVDVSGAVRAPGVYSLPAGSIVADAIAAAGGAAADADLDQVNKAVQLQDGVQIYIPRAGEVAPPPLLNPASPASQPDPGSPARVNINTATLEELDTLPEIGPATAQLIIDGRPYGAIEDLVRVRGIGQVTFDKVKEYITVK